MKQILAVIGVLLVGLACLCGAADNATTNYLGAVVFVPGEFGDAGDTGLVVSNAYLAIPASVLSGVDTNTYTDVRAVMYAIAQRYYVAWDASTNQSPSAATRSSYYAATTASNVTETVIHTLKTIRQFGEASLP
jgi:hypothetical protein